MTRIKFILVIAFFIPNLIACTLIAMKQDVDRQKVLIAAKEVELKTAEAEQARLREQSVQLKKDLATREVSLEDLKFRLERLQRANARTAEDTKEQRARKHQREVKLKTHQEDLIKLEKSSMTLEQKRKKIDSMKSDIIDTLNLLLQS